LDKVRMLLEKENNINLWFYEVLCQNKNLK
jgi:hypothetical protein